MRKLRLASLLVATLTMLQIVFPVATLAQTSISVSVKDIVAGSSAQLQTSVVNLNQANAGVFFVTDPKGTVSRVYAQPNPIYSVLTGELYGQQTRLAGVYTASVLLPGGVTSQPKTFRVYPAQTSLTQSKVKALDPMLGVGERGNIQVELLDAYGNPVPNNAIQLFSSRANDSIKPVNEGVVGKPNQPANTDKDGRAYFEISSPYTGAATFTALHLGNPLEQRADVVFSEAMNNGIGGSFLSSGLFGGNLLEANQAQQQQVIAGPVAAFTIDAPASATAGQDVSITVTAVDANGITAANYTGKVLMGVLQDDNATFPAEYQFTEADQGKHTFPLAFRFNTSGNVMIQVFDANNFQIGGEKTISVTPAGGVNIPGGNQSGSGSAPSIKSPASGTTVGTGSITITGMADTFKNIDLYVDGMKAQSLSTDGQGFFTATVNNLGDGSHDFYVMVQELGGGGQVSPTTSVTVDTSPPPMQSIILSPELSAYEPGQAITAIVVSEPSLDSASLTVNGIAYPLNPGVDPGSYSTTFAAPQAGQYGVKVSLTDALFNKSEYNAATFTVKGGQSIPSNASKVPGIEGQGGDGSITLVWDEATMDNPIQSYTVHYGLAFDKLTESVQVSAAQTTATLSNLQNGVTYYANVTATDSKGIVSEPSITLAIKPQAPEDQVPQIMDPDLLDGLSGNTAQSGLTTTSAENGVILQWQLSASQQALNPMGYMVYFGLQSGQYTDSYYVQGNVKSVLVPDLIPGIKYYFNLIPLNAMGQELSPIFSEVNGTPGTGGLLGANLLPAATGGPSSPNFLNNDTLAGVDSNAETGPEALWIVVLSLVASPLFYLYRRRIGV